MSTNSPIDKSFVILGGAVKTSGGALNLVKGQFAFVDVEAPTADGAKVISTFLGEPRNVKKFAARVGIVDQGVSKSRSNKAQSTSVFSIEEIAGISVVAPQVKEQKLDEVIIGYDGNDSTKTFAFKKGDPPIGITLKLSGGKLQFRGGAGAHEIITETFEVPSCDVFNSCEDCDECETVNCREFTLNAIKRLRDRQVVGGSTLKEYVDITPVFGGCTEDGRTLVAYQYYTLSVCDTGTDEALALVQAQYPNYKVRFISRSGSTSTYEMFIPVSAGAPADYASYLPSLIKGCEDCPAGYADSDEGFVYAITIEDDGVDRTSVIAAALAPAKYVAASGIKSATQKDGVGYYTLLYTSKITAAEIATFVGTTTNSRNTATVHLIGDVVSLCTDGSSTTTAWVAGDTCNASYDRYSIVLPDTSCGDDRLAELQGAYPSATIYAFYGTRSLTLTGTSGTANIKIGGVNYLATFNTNLETTADDFITTHTTALTAAGYTVTDGGVGELIFGGETFDLNAMTITNATGNLSGTFAASVSFFPSTGCQNKYEMLVLTNIACDECDDAFLDFYTSKAPAKYSGVTWKQEEVSTITGNCLCGIRFKGKSFVLATEEALRDRVNFEESATLIEVTAGYPYEIREGIGNISQLPYAVTEMSRWEPRPMLAGNMLHLEKEGLAHFLHRGYRRDYLGRVFLGETSSFEDLLAQEVQYTIEIRHNNYAQGAGAMHSHNMKYHFFVPVSNYTNFENLLNTLAGAAGVAPVKAY